MKKLINYFTSLLYFQMLLFPHVSQAALTNVVPAGGVGTVTITFPAVTVMKDAPVGTVLSTQTVYTGLKSFLTTSSGTLGFLFSCETDTCPTGVEGISYKLSASSDTFLWPHTFTNVPGGIGWMWGTAGMSVVVELYKSGEKTVSGTIQPQSIGKYNVQMEEDATPQTLAEIVLSGAVQVTALGCSLSSSDNLNVDLGNVPSRNFSGIGSTSGAKDFNVNLECDAGTNVNVNMSGTQSADSTDSSVLALTSAGSTGVSSGIGVQVLYNGTPLALNSDVVLGTSVAGGATTYTFSARYIQTLSKITAGTANTIATLNISYE
ncbi:fimbrial protein [Pantoea sp. Bo_2]|uniref:Fimbrial protein n=1 Tax=Candidatus Pantoea gossypiicola TaxID=2608008 RepID=A0AB34CJE1_9GAMM|nr:MULTISPECIES: fimbrial protein [Pantoea]KAA5928098.1 fimbrial protein [Pantoea sp. VH_8]KAA5934215.1 fimbrial protein [Pantoea sp. VH_4]KAA5942906.1 fimbrial protein [Pantoea sp. VH_3]KAA5950549.1 fimbrial protein [Pantoea sp. VH_25]KAA5956044.1 fimbrial protein [Pantoea sp. VH_24]